MNRIKVFGIGATVLYILLIINPIVNSINIENDKKAESFDSFDLGIKIDEFSLVENYAPAVWHESSRVYYKLLYTITNYGPYIINSEEVTLQLKILGMEKYPEHQIIFQWSDLVENLNVGESISLHYKFDNIKSSFNPSDDEERYFAGKFFSLTISTQKIDPNPDNNVDIGAVKFWSDKRGYEPTDSQVVVGAPHTYLNFSVYNGQLWYYQFPFNPENYSGLIRERLGYVWELFMFIYPMCNLIKKIIIDFIEFALTEKHNINIVLCWVDELVTCILCDIFGKPIPFGFINLLVDYFMYVRQSVTILLEKASIWLIPELIIAMQSMFDIIEKFEIWIQSEPWKNNITVQVYVSTIKENHEIVVRCRGVNSEDSGKTLYFFELSVPSRYGYEKFTWTRKDCTVKVHNWQTDQDQHSMKIFSWAYANGTMRVLRTIRFSRNRIIDNMKSFLKELFNHLKNKLNKIVSLFFSNILNDQYKEKNDDKIIKNFRDFNLDELIKKVKAEEEQYISYDVEYRKYEPRAVYNPKIVYYSSNQVIVGFKSYVDINKIDKVEGFPIVDKILELNTVVVKIYGIEPTDFMEIVNQSQDVEYAELNYVYQNCYIPNDPLWDEQWGLKVIKCPEAWDKQKGHWTISVAILDTGCNYLHEDISKKQSSANYDFINNDNDPMDDGFIRHGTHCAGIIGATIDNHKGIAGAAPKVWTDYIKILDSNGIGYASTIAKGIIHATKYDERIISMSLGGYGVSMLLHLACDYARYIKGVVLVAAAGNDGLPIVCYPARFKSVISVGAVDESLNLCSWSNYGPNLDLVAPGDNIISTVEGNKYMKLSGTSMATPHVAAVAALYFSSNLKSTATLCENKLFSTAIDLGSPGNDWKYGYGLVNAQGAVTNTRSINTKYKLIRFIPSFQLLLGYMKLN